MSARRSQEMVNSSMKHRVEFSRVNQGKEFNEFEALEHVTLELLESEGFEILNHEQPARQWANRLIAAGAPMNLVIRQFGKSIAYESKCRRHKRADEPTSLGFLLFEFWEMEGETLPPSIRQAWNSKPPKLA